MDKAAKASLKQKKKSEKKSEDIQEIQEVEKRIDEELDQSFPASDPPSYSQPGNDDIKHYEQDDVKKSDQKIGKNYHKCQQAKINKRLFN